MKLFANLHLHSTHSDGVYTPAELVRIAKKEGYRALALTDHDTTSGNAEMRRECEKEGLDFIFGCEFSSPWRERRMNFHIVGFDFDPEYPEMKEYLEQRSFCETDQTRILFERGLAEGLLYDITWNEVLEYNKGVTWLCNNHVFNTMKAKGLATDLDYMNFFNTVYGKRRGEVKPPYPFLPIDKLLRLIRDAGGFAVVAHPHNQLHAIPELIEMGVASLKIEGRMKSAYYAGAVTNAYRHAIDDVLAGRPVNPIWIEETEKLSHRPYNTGFYFGQPGQHTRDSAYFSGAEVCAVVESCDADGNAV